MILLICSVCATYISCLSILREGSLLCCSSSDFFHFQVFPYLNGGSKWQRVLYTVPIVKPLRQMAICEKFDLTWICMLALQRVNGVLGNPGTAWPSDYEAPYVTAFMNTINTPWHLAKKNFLMFAEGVNNGLLTCGASQDEFWGPCWNTGSNLSASSSSCLWKLSDDQGACTAALWQGQTTTQSSSMSPDGLLAVNQKRKCNITVTNTNVPVLCSVSVSSLNTNDAYIHIFGYT